MAIRNASEGASVVVIEPVSSGFTLLSTARECGFRVVVLSHDSGDRRLPDAAREHIDQLVVVDTNDEAAMLAAVEALPGVAAVMPGFEYYVPFAARIADRLGLPGLPAREVEGVRNKEDMLSRVQRAGLRIPRRAVATTGPELADAAARVGFPCVLKPVASAGSLHVRRADDLDQVRDAYQRIRDDDRLDLGRRTSTSAVMLTEYLAGPEVSVEGYVLDGRCVFVSVTGKLLGPEPNFVELGHIVQADLDPATRTTVERYVEKVVRALSVTLGPFHCELRLVNDEPVLIELGARLAGDHIVDLVEQVEGTSLTKVMIAAYTGLSLDDVSAVRAPTAKYAGIRFFMAPPRLASYQRIHGLDQIAGSPGVVRTGVIISPGTPLFAPEHSDSRLGWVIFTADSYDEALRRWERIGEAIHVD